MKELPGSVWVAILMGIAAALQQTLPPEQFPWAAGVVVIIGGVAKILEVYLVKKPVAPPADGGPQPAAAFMPPAAEPSKISRVLWG